MTQFIAFFTDLGNLLADLPFREPHVLGIYAPLYWVGVVAGGVGGIFLIKRLALQSKDEMPWFLVFVLLLLLLFCAPSILMIALFLLASLLENFVITGLIVIVSVVLTVWYKRLRKKPAPSN